MYRLDYSRLNGVTNLDMTYDALGNITNQTSIGAYDYTTAQSGCTYYSNAQRHAVRKVGSNIYCYDANGNMVSRAGQAITWTSYNYVSSLGTLSGESASFDYGPIANAGG